jgi:DNA-binding transcriptional ArsR family regulator
MKSGFEDYAQTHGGLHHVGALTDSAEKNTTLIRKCGVEFVRILDGEPDWLEDLPKLREDLFNLIEKGCPKLDLIDLSFACTRGRTHAISDTLKSIGLADPPLQVLAQLCEFLSEKISALNLSGAKGVIHFLPQLLPELPDDENRARIIRDLHRLPELLGLYGDLLRLYPPKKELQAKIDPILREFELVLFYELLSHFNLGYPTLSRLLKAMREARCRVNPKAKYVRPFERVRTRGKRLPVKDPLGEMALQRRLLRFAEENVNWHNGMVWTVERYLSDECSVQRAIGASLLTLAPTLMRPAETGSPSNIQRKMTRKP